MKLVENRIRISVRNLVEFVLRSGNLDSRRGKGRDAEAMQAGNRIHRKIQKKMGPEYCPEVSLKMEIPLGDVVLMLEGRADGVINNEDGLLIDEIKGVYFDPAGLEEPVPVHLAQVICYAYILAVQEEKESAAVQVTYCNLETEDIRVLKKEYTKEELEERFFELVNGYRKWAEYLYHHRLERKESLKGLEFPFPYRQGQRKLAVSVYRSLEQQKTLFIQASTGIGKTMSVLFPALKAVGEDLGDKIFYLTAKTVTGKAAQEAMEILAEKGLKASSVMLTAKEKVCIFADLDTEAECTPLVCERAKGHFDRVNEAVYDLITHEETIGRDKILSYAEKHQVCPFEMALDVTNWLDVIICDYNYVYDPNVRLKRFFADEKKGDYFFLVDEAHNLVERAREMYSAVLVKEEFLEAKRFFKTVSKTITRSLDKCNRHMLELKRQCETWRLLDTAEISPLLLEVDRLYSHILSYEEDHPSFVLPKEQTSFFFRLRDFLNIYDGMDENYEIYTEMLPDGSFLLKLFCVNPSGNLNSCNDQGLATVYFSATLLPIRYYKHCLTGREEDYAIYAGSPFTRENRKLLAACDVTTKYTSRNAREYEKVADYLEAMVMEQPGNYLAFFPSYAYLQEIKNCLESRGRDVELLVQKQNMKEQERQEFLEQFEEQNTGRKLGLAVMGGVFSEGIDLTGDRLIGVAVVGTGLPMVCTEREILRQFYQETGVDGFDYAYRFPGFNKVEQAVGRLIRTKEDQGVILLMDHRFLNPEYLEQFPEEWLDFQVVNRESVAGEIRWFWTNRRNHD